MRQTGETLVHCHPERPVVEDLLNSVGAENGFPVPGKVVAQTQADTMGNAWAAFWGYTKRVDPDVLRHVDYVPMSVKRHATDHVLIV